MIPTRRRSSALSTGRTARYLLGRDDARSAGSVGAEPFILRALLAIAAERGAVRLIGEYLPTARNGVVAELYARLGFTPAGEGRWDRPVGPPDLAGLDTAIRAVE